MSTPLKYDQPMSTAILVRLTPPLHDLCRQAADIEESSLGDFMRAAVIHRLAQLELVPVEDGHDEPS